MTTIETTLETVANFGKKDRFFLIRKSLEQPSVACHIVNAPTGAAQIDNAIYALEENLRETPDNELSLRAYLAIGVEFPEHFKLSYSEQKFNQKKEAKK